MASGCLCDLPITLFLWFLGRPQTQCTRGMHGGWLGWSVRHTSLSAWPTPPLVLNLDTDPAPDLSAETANQRSAQLELHISWLGSWFSRLWAFAAITISSHCAPCPPPTYLQVPSFLKLWLKYQALWALCLLCPVGLHPKQYAAAREDLEVDFP